MFTEKTMAIVERAKCRAFSLARDRVDLESVLAAIGADAEAGVRLADCLTGGDIADLRGRCPELGKAASPPGKMEPDDNLRHVLETALELASGKGVPDRTHPGFIALEHLVCGVAISRAAVEMLGDGLAPLTREEALKLLTSWMDSLAGGLSLGDLVGRLRGLRTELLSKVFGQDHAAQAFVEGLYNAQVTAVADKQRKRPEGIFVFAGPPGVGKTFMSELCAACLERPFRRFDMTGFTDHQSHNDLVGFAESYKGAQPGQLTGFVDSNPNAILLFDEIEKAHMNTMQLFYQVLDAGRLEDKFMKKDVSFRDTLIIFTTNAGRSLYDDPNRMGIGVANATWHKRTILSALENESNPSDGRPAFPPAICSRLGQGYAIMFNHLGINELEKIVNVEMRRVEGLLERQYFKAFRHDERLPISLVFREGARVDARQLRAEAEKFVKAQLFRFFSLYTHDRIGEVLEDFDTAVYSVERTEGPESRAVEELFQPTNRPKILLAADNAFMELCRKQIKDIDLVLVSSPLEAMEKLAVEDVDYVLLDLWLGAAACTEAGRADYMALEAGELRQGREMLKLLHERFPLIPVYLLSLMQRGEEARSANERKNADQNAGICSATIILDGGHGETSEAVFDDEKQRRPIDDELFLACVQAGGARGLVSTDFGIGKGPSHRGSAREFTKSLEAIHHRLYREKKARILAKERKVLSFDTVSELDRDRRTLNIRLCNFRLSRALDASDAGELVEDISRPATRFADVLGATEAKKSMQFIVDWLRNPKKYHALGLRPPKGVLMAGSPGTGKTMLARALAGESDCAFMEKSATSFVTKWQGSGPQNVRDLFARARRYAPAIVFIDEIDAIGKARTGSTNTRAEEETLNALLTEMDGFSVSGNETAPVIVLAATNLVEHLDEALTRRFDRTIDVDKPDREARLTYLKKAMGARRGAHVSEQTLERLAGQTAGMTIANLERVIQEAGVMAAQTGVSITDEMLEEAFEKARMGVSKEAPDAKTLERIARHEAGHTMIAWLGGNLPVQVTIVGRGGAGGFMEREADEKRIIYTKPEIEQLIRESMGGRAAELLYYGDEDGLSTGVGSDLSHASRWAARMVQEFGMDNVVGQLAVSDITGNRAGDGPLSAQVAQQVRHIVDEQLKQAVTILQKNRSTLDALIAKLLKKNRLTREEMKEILDKPQH
jgi:ATP-dependent metalloprotease FtsH